MSAGFAAQLSDDKAAIMHRATEDLRTSDLLKRALGKGDTMPPFALPDEAGTLVRSDDLLTRGPLVVSFFRGFW